MKKKKIKIIIFSMLILGMIYYIGWVFYMSEPTYIDNCYKKIERYDYVSLPKWEGSYKNTEVQNGIVLQVDSINAIVKVKSYSDEYYQLDIKKSNYRIIGKGTLYHKVNNYVGFNIMIITQIFIGILAGILIISLVSILNDFLNNEAKELNKL